MRGAIMKGGHWNMNMNATHGSSRRRLNLYLLKVIIMLLFGAALLGLMGMHRAKDRSRFDLFIEEKDAQIFSLRLLLQKERESVQEERNEIDEMKMKIYSLRAQKIELKGRVLEMESTISSLREKQRTTELALEKKQNEIKNQNDQVKALTDMLQQKETEIEGLKNHFQLHNTDDPSILPTKTTDQIGDVQELRYKETESSAQTEELRDGVVKPENSQDTSVENGRAAYDPQNQESFDTEKNTNEIEVTENVGNEDQKPQDEDITKLASEENLNSQGTENQEVGEHNGGSKLEMQGNKHSGRTKLRGKHGYLKRAKGKRWRGTFKEVQEKKSSENNEGKIVRDQKFIEGTEEVGNRVDEKATLRGSSNENSSETIEDIPSSIELQNNTNTIDTEDMSRDEVKVEEIEMSRQVEEEDLTNSSSEKSDVHLDESEIGGSSNEGIVQHLEDELSKNEDIISKQDTDNKNIDNHDDSPQQIKVAEKNGDSDDLKIEDFEEPGSGTNNSGVSGSSVDNVIDVDTEQKNEQEF